jgi:D-alanyl-D-alanine carboxypeptidase/D-alanyl-D-alanine-endopeptidase (penicillin-binding protein 4)
MGMRVDLVAAPIRYPRAPLFLLLVLALVPTIALAALFSWSDDQADTYEAARSEEGAEESPSQPLPPPSELTPALATGLFSYRRAFEDISDFTDRDRLAEAVDPIYGFINDRSCVAVSVDGRPVTTKNGHTPVIPASTQKLLIAAVALETLGDDYRFSTTVAAPTPVDGVVEGDIYLIGGGDPNLVSDDYPIEDDPHPAFNTTSLDRLADAIVGSGITTIRGAVVGDGSRYDDEFFIASWGDDVVFIDGGPYDALLVNDSRTLGRSSRERDPNEAAAREFARLLGNRGVSVNNGWTSGPADPNVPIVGQVESEPLSAVVAEMLTTSDNNTAEMLLKELGFADSGEGTVAGGLNVVDRTLRSWGVPMEGVRLVDGSGLSIDNRLTCAALLAVLQRAGDGALRAGLPVAARTGTLSEEFTESSMEGRLVAKTGTLSNPPADSDPPAVKALAGYLDATDGSTIEFVIIQTGPDITNDGKYQALWLALGDRLDTYPDGPGTDGLGPR